MNKNIIGCTAINKLLIMDTSLSYGALGLLCYLKSLPKHFEINETNISKERNIKKEILHKYFDELLKKEYIKVIFTEDKDGTKQVYYKLIV